MQNSSLCHRREQLSQALALRNELYNKAYAEKRWHLCRQIAQDRNRLLQHFKNLEQTTNP